MSTGFFKAATRPERGPSRPKFVNPKTGEMQSWQRASNFAAPLDSGFGMVKHKTRQLVRGFNRRLDLARMLLTGAVIDDKIDEVIETALTAAEDEAKANNGTAVHAALQLCDTGADVPEEYWPHARAYVAELKRYGLRPVAVEQRILNTRLDATGTFDRVYVTDSGRYLIGDIKSGSLKYPHGYAVQCEVYAGGDYLVHPDDTTEPIPWDIDQNAALIIHVDPDTGATSIYEVPLRVARWGAALAEQVRAFQRTDILLPYSGAPAGPLAEELRREASRTPLGQVVDGMREAAQRARDSVAVSTDQASALHHTQTSATEPAVRSAPLDSSTTPTAPSAASAPTASPSDLEARMAELMKTSNTKPKLQQMLRELGWNPSDLAHNRKWLAAKIIEIETSNAGARAAGPSGAAAVAQTVAQTVEQDVPRGEATPFMLKQLADAPSTADIERIRANVIAQSGAAAWTPAMEEVARVRVAELQPQTSPLSRIADAKSKQDIAQIWSDVTGDGATPSAWTPAYESAAVQRAATFAATPPVNPNPWGSQ